MLVCAVVSADFPPPIASERCRPRTPVFCFALSLLSAGLVSFSVFFFLATILLWESISPPMPPSSLQAWVLPFLDVPELCSTPGFCHFFFLWNICCSPSRDALCCFCPLCFDMVSCTPFGHRSCPARCVGGGGGLRVLFNAMTAPSMLAVVLWSSFESTFVTSFVHLPFPSCRPFDSAYALVLSFPFAGLSLLHLVLKPSIARIATVKLLRHSPHFLEHLAPWAAFQGAMEEMTVT